MSAPRQIVPGVTYLLTRRCFGRLLLLRPSAEINAIFEFCLAVAAARTGVLIHAYVVLSNHYHLVATDPDGRLPEFMHWLNEYVAKCVNAKLGRWESFWAPGSYSALALGDDEALVGRLVYTFTNPVGAALVRTHTEWPGAKSLPEDMGTLAKVVERPKGFFHERGSVPETAVLRVVPPPGFSADRSSWLPALCEGVRAREAEIRAECEQSGRRFLGPREVLRQSPHSRPQDTEVRRGLNPRIAVRDKWKRLEALQRLKSFLHSYRAAWKEFVDGNQSVIFPLGTYGMRVQFGVACASP